MSSGESSASESAPRSSSAKEKLAAAPAPESDEAQEDPEAKAQDPVVNSVMAQFAKLQRDIAQRRKKK